MKRIFQLIIFSSLLLSMSKGECAISDFGTVKQRVVESSMEEAVDDDRIMDLIEVQDNGPGMDEQTQRRVFEPFFTTKAVGVGTGLGLSVSYFIVTEQHKGTLDVSSQPGEGTCFTMCLPLEGSRAT